MRVCDDEGIDAFNCEFREPLDGRFVKEFSSINDNIVDPSVRKLPLYEK
jgi:hypothetical protein